MRVSAGDPFISSGYSSREEVKLAASWVRHYPSWRDKMNLGRHLRNIDMLSDPKSKRLCQIFEIIPNLGEGFCALCFSLS